MLLVRKPYNKDSVNDAGFKGAGRGFVVIFQDCRGRYASEGEWYPFQYVCQPCPTRIRTQVKNRDHEAAELLRLDPESAVDNLKTLSSKSVGKLN